MVPRIDGELLVRRREFAALAVHHVPAAGGVLLVALDAAFQFLDALAVELDLALGRLDLRAMLPGLLAQRVDGGLDLVVGLARLGDLCLLRVDLLVDLIELGHQPDELVLRLGLLRDELGVMLVPQMGVQHAQVLVHDLVALRLRGLALERCPSGASLRR